MSNFENLLKAKPASPTPAPAAFNPRVPIATPNPAAAASGGSPFGGATFGGSIGGPPPLGVTTGFGSVVSQTARMQCQPVLRMDAGNLWSRTEQAVGMIYRAMQDASLALGIDAYVGRNNAFEFPFAALFDCWVPPQPNDPNLTERAWARVSVEPKPNHRFELEYTVEIENRGRKKVLGKFGDMQERDIHALLTYLVRRKPRPHFGPRIRVPSDGFFKSLVSVNNKSMSSRRDYLRTAAGALLGVGSVGLFIGMSAGSGVLTALCALPLLLGAAASVYIYRQPLAVRSTGRPAHQPRRLRAYDSWQTVVFGAAKGADTFRQRFFGVLQAAPITGFKAEVEHIGYRALDEVVSREQIVLTAKRGIVYCQLYQFGEDLYIGWQSFINQGRWSEKVDSHGVDRATGRRVEMRSVVPSAENLCEYDFFDANCLTEWTHAQLVTLTKQMLKELQIDQEMDFKITRGDRNGNFATAGGGEQPTPEPTGGLKGLLRRKA